MPRGRPKTTVKEKLEEKGYNLEEVEKLAMFGLTDMQLANLLNVNESTINRWKADPEFMQVLKKGKDKADNEVEQSLHMCAVGYYKETGKATKDGAVTIMEYYPPNTTAQIFWLKNRKPQQWRDKQDVELSGSMNQNVKIDTMTDEEKDKRMKDLLDKAKIVDGK